MCKRARFALQKVSVPRRGGGSGPRARGGSSGDWRTRGREAASQSELEPRTHPAPRRVGPPPPPTRSLVRDLHELVDGQREMMPALGDSADPARDGGPRLPVIVADE